MIRDKLEQSVGLQRSLFGGASEISIESSWNNRKKLKSLRSKMVSHRKLSISIVVAVVVLVSNSMAFTIRHSHERKSHAMRYSQEFDVRQSAGRSCYRKGLHCLSMASREEKLRMKNEILISMKQVKSKKSYNVPGYVKGRLDLIRSVFKIHSLNGEMTYSAFLDSKYLRFWPGTKSISFLRMAATSCTDHIVSHKQW